MFDIVDKHWPMSEGDGKATRKKRPRILAITTDCCTGCSGSPACIEYCPIEACMFWVPDEDHAPFGRIEVDPYLCIGCQKCTSKGPDGAFLDGCPGDAIEMVPTDDWEAVHGITLPDAPPAPPA
jgi:ferredoxin